MKTIKVSAPGKIHLLGEHTVVYGKPAILASVNKRCFAELIPKANNKVVLKSFDSSWEGDIAELLEKREKARRALSKYKKTEDISYLKKEVNSPTDYLKCCAGENLLFLKKSSGFELSVRTEIQLGSGMGSSAALAVCVAGAFSKWADKVINNMIVNQIAFSCEELIHGIPSGGDNTTSCYGDLIWFRKETSSLKIMETLKTPASSLKNFLIIDSGRPQESTGEMINSVKKLSLEKPKYFDNILIAQEALVRELALCIEDKREITGIIKAGEKNLEKLGVVSPSARRLIRIIDKAGGAAKICGAGGIKKGSGIILAYHKDQRVIKDLLISAGIKFFKVDLGAEGVREEE